MKFVGEVVWSLPWVEVLAPELRGKVGSAADHVNFHTRVPAPPFDIKCSSAAQARQLLQAVQRQLVSLLHMRIMNTSIELSGTSIEDAATPLEQVLLLHSRSLGRAVGPAVDVFVTYLLVIEDMLFSKSYYVLQTTPAVQHHESEDASDSCHWHCCAVGSGIAFQDAKHGMEASLYNSA